jgi:hypothetical protein
MIIKYIFGSGLLLLVVACGGGGGSTPTSGNGVAISEASAPVDPLVVSNLPVSTYGEAVFNVAFFQFENEGQYFDQTIFQ